MPDTPVQIEMKKGEPVTLGTTSIRTSERLGGLLQFYSREAP
jgi:hypothetical protein